MSICLQMDTKQLLMLRFSIIVYLSYIPVHTYIYMHQGPSPIKGTDCPVTFTTWDGPIW